MSKFRYSVIAIICILNLFFTGTTNQLPQVFDFVKTAISSEQCHGPCSPLHRFISYRCEGECFRNNIKTQETGCTPYQALNTFSPTSKIHHQISPNSNKENCHKPNLLAFNSNSDHILTVQKLE